MAEVAGLVLSGVGLVTLISTVSDCFESVETARGFGRHYEQHALQLDVANFALQRWRQSVSVLDSTPDPELATQLALASEQETDLVRKLLGNIALAFADAEKTARRYTPPLSRSNTDISQDSELIALDEKVRRAYRRRQSSVSAAKKARWVLHDAKALQTLVDQVSRNVKSLVDLFPGTASVTAREFQAVVNPANIQALKHLQAAAESVDPAMEQRATEALISRAPLWEDNVAGSNSWVAYGDIVGSDYNGKAMEVGYRYTGNRTTGSARVTYGTRYGSQYKEPFGRE